VCIGGASFRGHAKKEREKRDYGSQKVIIAPIRLPFRFTVKFAAFCGIVTKPVALGVIGWPMLSVLSGSR